MHIYTPIKHFIYIYMYIYIFPNELVHCCCFHQRTNMAFGHINAAPNETQTHLSWLEFHFMLHSYSLVPHMFSDESNSLKHTRM